MPVTTKMATHLFASYIGNYLKLYPQWLISHFEVVLYSHWSDVCFKNEFGFLGTEYKRKHTRWYMQPSVLPRTGLRDQSPVILAESTHDLAFDSVRNSNEYLTSTFYLLSSWGIPIKLPSSSMAKTILKAELRKFPWYDCPLYKVLPLWWAWWCLMFQDMDCLGVLQ